MNSAALFSAIHALPTLLQAEVLALAEQFEQEQPENLFRLFEHHHPEVVARVWACSPFVARYLSMPARFSALLNTGHWERCLRPGELGALVKAAIAGASEAERLRQLRTLRQREMVRIAWRDISRVADLEETMRDLSALADACISASLDACHDELAAQWGLPCDAAGNEQSLLVIAMGKLGAGELNFSSDIDLIFCYPNDGQTKGGPRSLSNEEFFQRLGQRLIKSLNATTEDGFVFRVDMRLRPFGDSGPLVTTFDAMDAYYSSHARDWERYAMVKARIVTGSESARLRLAGMLRPFVYRRYLDFGAFDALRDMKRMIVQELKRKGIENNIKLGPGGIREVEFIAQCFQLIRGGRQPQLQERCLLKVLDALQRLGHLSPSIVKVLQSGYRFLRVTEHRIQQIRDEQTQNLPQTPLDQTRLAWGMGFATYPLFLEVLQTHRQQIQLEFERLLDRDQSNNTDAANEGSWPGLTDPEHLSRWLRCIGHAEPEPIVARLLSLATERRLRQLSSTERNRLERLFPALLQAIHRSAHPVQALDRVIPIIEATLHRSVYFALLTENKDALDQLIVLAAASPWIANYIARHPILLDELIDPRVLYRKRHIDEFEAGLEAVLAQASSSGLEHEIDRLRQFKHAQVLHIAAADIVGQLEVADVSDLLTAIAECVLRGALQLAWRELTARYGLPRKLIDGQDPTEAGFAIVAYGKLGSYELGYGSDLDVIFLHDDEGTGHTDNPQRSISNTVFFTRLAQRIIHILSVATAAGQAYEIDTRLRPSGAAGLLVSGVDAYRAYQQEQAWTWEHQALVRARAVSGSPQIQAKFSAIRRAALMKVRNDNALRIEINDMRRRMLKERDGSNERQFDLKQGQGGITDIEFMVQYLVLRHAAECPSLLDATSNRALLALCARHELLPAENCENLLAAYFAYRKRAHELALQQQPSQVPATEFLTERRNVQRVWQHLFNQ